MTPEQRLGLAAALTSYFIWGVFPLYFQLIKHVSAFEILLHRILWAVPVLILVLTVRKSWVKVLDVFRTPRVLGGLLLSSLVISTNWFIYTWLVTKGDVLEVSLGYFINPLMTVALGVVFLRERMRPLQVAAVGLACLGVVNQILFLGVAPVAALALAATFACYAFIRKLTPVGPMSGLFVEVLFVFPPAIAVFLWLNASGGAQFFNSPSVTLLLFLCGPLTVLPLVLFSFGARRLRLITLGISQYLGPTLQFVIALALGEPFSIVQGVTFACIWAGLAIFTAEALTQDRRLRTAV